MAGDGKETYVLSFTIFDARGLVTLDGNPVDPYVEVRCCGKTWYSEQMEEKITIATWNQNHIWNDIRLYKEEFETAYVEISVYARNWFTRDDLIGSCSLQLASVNNRKNHIYAKKWMVLRTEADPDPKGMIKITAFCLRPGDTPPSGEQQEGGEEGGGGEGEEDFDLSKAVLGELDTSSIGGKPHHVLVTIYRVEDLPVGEGLFDQNNPFLTVEFSGCIVQSQVAKNSTSFAYNETARIPVMTPVFEDTVLLKLWNWNRMSPDQLLAQGFLSFSELRNRPLLPRWFNFYGWNQDEVDLTEIAAVGEMIPANCYLGRVLVSARIEKLSNPADLQPARMIGVTVHADEPPQIQVALLCDVYQVTGVVGRECQVEILFGNAKPQESEWQGLFGGERRDKRSIQAQSEDNEMTAEDVPTFIFKHPKGRIAPAVTMVPEDPASQFKIFLNVYTRGLLSGRQRVAFCSMDLSAVVKYDDGAATTPKFFPLHGIPGMGTSIASSILLTMEWANKDDVPRAAPKAVLPGPYLLRAYIFRARNVVYEKDSLPNLELKVSCAGVSKSTGAIKETACPRWMKVLELRITLLADDANSPPTMENIIVTLNHSTFLSSAEIGRAACHYSYMRMKDALGAWEPFRVEPQWVQLFGGAYGAQEESTYRGDVLLAFEMMHAKPAIVRELVPQEMWPVDKMRKVTLHFALLGVRDLCPLAGFIGYSAVTVEDLRVIVRVPSFDKETNGQPMSPPLMFKFSPVKPGGNPSQKADRNKTWTTQGNRVSAEYLQVQSLHCLVAENAVLDQFLHLEVKSGCGDDPDAGTLVGEARLPVSKFLPWYDSEKDDAIRDASKLYVEPSQQRRQKLAAEVKAAKLEAARKGLKIDISAASTVEKVTSAGLPAAYLKPTYKERLDIPYGYKLDLWATSLNMQLSRMDLYKEMPAPKAQEQGGRPQAAGRNYDGLLENEHADFYFRSVPLQRGNELNEEQRLRDQIRLSDVEGTFGFVKCAFFFEEGLQPLRQAAKKEDDEDEPLASQPSVDPDEPPPRRSAGLPGDLVALFDEEKFREKFKDEQSLPPRIRVRIYMVKGNVVFTKGGELFPDPFVDIKMGSDIDISGRNNFLPNTCQPQFYRIEERDVELPQESRLEVLMKTYDDMGLGDPLIGSTIIDLEDRWHSAQWQEKMEKGSVPIENRGLWRVGASETGGTIELWMEMVDSFKASEVPPSPLRAPPPNNLEIRLVIWKTKSIKIVKSATTDVKFKVSIDCGQYDEAKGGYPKTQDTDVHYGSKDGVSVFNWRVVYPCIVMPVQSCTMQIAVYDYNLIGGDVYIGNVNLDLKKYLEKVSKTAELLEMENTDLPILQGEDTEAGIVTVSLWVYMQSEANGKPAGPGRSEPNQFPQLITPIEGRGWGDVLSGFGFSLSLPNWQKFAVMLMLGCLVCVIILKQMGLL